mmetsp:Transcript_51768/g.118950  ORF Transcript_51768/g.118950 Transcript_51768/m.118950 type:complete len:206 (-) Transcript_51768:1261-1878(-)
MRSRRLLSMMGFLHSRASSSSRHLRLRITRALRAGAMCRSWRRLSRITKPPSQTATPTCTTHRRRRPRLTPMAAVRVVEWVSAQLGGWARRWACSHGPCRVAMRLSRRQTVHMCPSRGGSTCRRQACAHRHIRRRASMASRSRTCAALCYHTNSCRLHSSLSSRSSSLSSSVVVNSSRSCSRRQHLSRHRRSIRRRSHSSKARKR